MIPDCYYACWRLNEQASLLLFSIESRCRANEWKHTLILFYTRLSPSLLIVVEISVMAACYMPVHTIGDADCRYSAANREVVEGTVSLEHDAICTISS